jgi:photosystem II stability/assembly factor-like uncharacterized protein
MKRLSFLTLCSLTTIQLFSQWELQTLSDDGCLEEIEFTSNATGFVVGNSVIGKTINGGEIWEWNTSIGGAFRIIDFINQDTAMVCCFPYLGEDIMVTYDGGETWDMPSLYISVETNDMELVPNGNIINAVGWTFDGSEVYVAEDFYSEISSVYLLSSSIPPYDIDFITNEVGFICGRLDNASGSTVFKTTDGGYSWYTNENMTGPVFEMSFPTVNIGYGIGDEARVWKTNDSGESWSMLPFDFGGFDVVDNSLFLRNIYFFNDTIGYLEVGIIYPDFTEGIYIYRSIDGGEFWYRTEINYDDFDGVNSFWCTSEDTCYAVECTEVYKTTNGGGIDTGTVSNNDLSTKVLKLYPNPTSGVISINLPESSLALPILINIYGQKQPFKIVNLSENKIEIDFTELPSGIYQIDLIVSSSHGHSARIVKL